MLKLYFPHWQGSDNTNDLYFSARDIYDMYLKEAGFLSIDVCRHENLRVRNGVLVLDEILDNLVQIVHLLEEFKPEKIFSYGGDCRIEIGPVSYLNMRCNGDLAVLWFDAHGDLNTPVTSPSKHFHGMPLRCLLGEGDETILEHCFSYIAPSQVILAGVNKLIYSPFLKDSLMGFFIVWKVFLSTPHSSATF
jgi:arginase